jgi:integrase/recombinase XerC
MPETTVTLIQDFLNYLRFQKRYSPHTSISYETDLTEFFQFLAKEEMGELPLASVKAIYIRNWLASLKEAGRSAKTINRKISSLKSFFKFHLKKGVIAASPMVTIVSPKISKRLPQYVEQQQMDTLFNHVEFPDNWEGSTHRLILLLLYNTGMRRAELAGLRESQIDMGNNSLKVLGKGNKERIIPISSSLVNQLQQYMAAKRTQFETGNTEFLLLTGRGTPLYDRYIYKIVTQYLSMVTTIDKKSPHVLRHTFATHLTGNGADLNAVKELLGHSSLAATQVYTHNTIARLKDAHKKAHPKG